MGLRISRVEIRYEQDIVYARQRTRLIAELLGFDRNDQTRICTAVSEIARNAYQYGGGGDIEFQVTQSEFPQLFMIVVSDKGPGVKNLNVVLEGRYTSNTGMGIGLIGTRKLMDRFDIVSKQGLGTIVTFGKQLPSSASLVTPEKLRQIADKLAAVPASTSALDEIRTQNAELLAALDTLRQREDDLTRVNLELSETNSNITTLYDNLEKKTVLLEQSEKLLRSRNLELKGFAYTISHDLKAPLRGISGYATELDRKHRAGLSERAQFCVSQIQVAANNLDSLIEDLLYYSGLDAETPTYQQVNLRKMVDGILRDRGLLIAEKQVRVQLDLQCESMEVWERGVLQVLTNLIDNALKYTARTASPQIGIHAVELEGAWQVSVSDNGIGFDMKYHDRIFGLFTRLVSADEFEGTGAGLAIVKKVLDKQAGRIWAEAVPGQGATFFVELPKPVIN